MSLHSERMKCFVSRIAMVHVNKPLTVHGTDWPEQLIEKLVMEKIQLHP